MKFTSAVFWGGFINFWGGVISYILKTPNSLNLAFFGLILMVMGGLTEYAVNQLSKEKS